MPRHEAALDYLIDSANIIVASGWQEGQKRQQRLAEREADRLRIEENIRKEPVSPEEVQRRLNVTAEALGAVLLKGGVDAETLSAFLGDFTAVADSILPGSSVTHDTSATKEAANAVHHSLGQTEYTESLLRKVVNPQAQMVPYSPVTTPPTLPSPRVTYASMDEFLTDAPEPTGSLREYTFWEPHKGTLALDELEIPATPDPFVVKVEPAKVLPSRSLVDPEDTAYMIIDAGMFHTARPGEPQGRRLQDAFDQEETVIMRPIAEPETIILPVPKPWEVAEPSGAWPQ
jgi:hypothetical protein